jgi:hypothetical protein
MVSEYLARASGLCALSRARFRASGLQKGKPLPAGMSKKVCTFARLVERILGLCGR